MTGEKMMEGREGFRSYEADNDRSQATHVRVCLLQWRRLSKG